MKKFAIICIVLGFIFCGCKYDEGPFISLREAETRIAGVWELVNVYKNGEKITTSEFSAHTPGTYYTFYFDSMMSVTAIVNGNIRQSNQGYWYFKENEKMINIEFQLPGEHYMYDATIKKLTMSELRYEFTDQEGDVWRFELYTRSHF